MYREGCSRWDWGQIVPGLCRDHNQVLGSMLVDRMCPGRHPQAKEMAKEEEREGFC
jgi:hypothetical protein